MITNLRTRLVQAGLFAAASLAASGSAHATCLDDYVSKVPIDALNQKPAYSLTAAEARDVILYLIQQGQVTLPPSGGWVPIFDGKCNIIPDPLRNPSASKRIAIVNKIGDAQFPLYSQNANRKGTPSTPSILYGLQPRLVVGLARLVAYLNDTNNFRVYHIYTTGIAAVAKGDHKDGVAIDFAGVRGENIDTKDSAIYVEDDWGKQPVPGPNDQTVPCLWPRTAPRTSYRLDQPLSDNSPRGQFPRQFFRGVHDFFAREFAGCPGNPIESGCAGDRLKHPDYFKSNSGDYGREAHYNHIHAGMKP